METWMIIVILFGGVFGGLIIAFVIWAIIEANKIKPSGL